jgi:hypothetical protein
VAALKSGCFVTAWSAQESGSTNHQVDTVAGHAIVASDFLL